MSKIPGGAVGMSDSNVKEIIQTAASIAVAEPELSDMPILCIDCAQEFTWTAGEQLFYREKNLLNPPKRCKGCKKAKNRRLEAIELAHTTGQPHKIEVRADCARCSESTTVPFYPSQGRPVYCRQCFTEMKADTLNGSGA